MSTQPLSLTHLVREPIHRTESGKPPLLMLLHGVGSNEQDLMGLAEFLDPRFFIISARAPLMLGPGAFGWYQVRFTEQGPRHAPEEAEAGRMAAARFLEEASAAYGLNREQAYVMGFSQGAITSLSIALTEPELIAGAVIMSGRLLPEVAARMASADRLEGMPFFVAHGTHDTVLPVQYGREIQTMLSTLPVELAYREYEMAHQVSEESLQEISAWLTAHLDNGQEVML